MDAGYKVRVLIRKDSRSINGLPVEISYGDILDKKSLSKALEGAYAVIHSAAQISISPRDREQVWKVNVMGTRNVLDSAVAAGVKRFVHISSIHAFKDKRQPVNEESELVMKEGSAYDRSKAESIRLVMNHNDLPDKVVICPTALLGPHDYKPSFMGRFLISLARKDVPAIVTGGFDWVDVRDVAKAAVKSIENGNGIYITAGKYLSIVELANIWCEICRVKSPKLTFPLSLAVTFTKIAYPLFTLFKSDIILTPEALNALKWKSPIIFEKATRELSYNPRPIEETLKDTYRWFKENGYI